MTRMRLTVVMTHPVQYFSPWARHISATCPEIDLTVVYAIEPTPEQQGTGFGQPITWDVPLREGYHSVVCRAARRDDSVASKDFGLDVPHIGDILGSTAPDLVLVPGWNARVLERAIGWARRHDVPLLYRGDSHLESSPPGWRRRASRLRARWRLSQFDGALAVGVRAHEYLAAMGVPREAVFRSPHTVDNAFFAAAAAPFQQEARRGDTREALGIRRDAFVVAYVGKLLPAKRPLDAVRAISGLPFPATLVIAGAGVERPACELEASSSDAPVRFLGFTNQGDLGRVYGIADALVLPSTWAETWGLVANEALACGVPIIVSDQVGCAPDLVVSGQTGSMFRCGDVSSLRRAIIDVRSRMTPDTAAACRAHVAAYSFATATEGLRQACRRTLEARGRTPAPRVLVCAEHQVIPGGLERMTAEVVRAVKDAGGTAHWLLNDWDSWQIAALAEMLDCSWSHGRNRVPLTRHSRNPWYWIRLVRELVASNRVVLGQAKRRRITHVFLPDALAVVRHAPALGLLRLTGCRSILRLGVAPPQHPFYPRFYRLAVEPFVDSMVCNSRFTERELHAIGVGLSKSCVIANVSPRRSVATPIAETRDATRAIFIGQLIPHKGLHLLLEAVAALVAGGSAMTLDVVGDLDRWEPPSYAGYRASLLARARKPDLAGRVRFLGAREDIPALLKAAGVHVAPSLPEFREAFGLVVLEAKEAGVPSIVFRSGSLPDLVRHESDGLVCDVPGVDALVGALKYYFEDPQAAERHGLAALASAAPFSRAQFARAWAAQFDVGSLDVELAVAPLMKKKKQRDG
ncbi:MAG TPA: glycosyltransferase family 4 protein [Vicinamibacterales bacterium]|nr:glycosyltransferase family 4 protein [Vicinamibacterales bacterium]